MTKHKDFDAYRRQREPVSFTYEGHTYYISGKIPFEPMLEAMAMAEEGQAVGSDAKVVTSLLKEIIGDENYARLMKDLDLRDAELVLYGIIEMVMGEFSDDQQAEAQKTIEDMDGGKAQRLRKKLESRRSTSSSTGTESKPTSAGITVSGVRRSAG